MEMRVVDGSRSPVSPFGSAVSLDPARRVPRNDQYQPAPLAVLGGCRPEVTISTPGSPSRVPLVPSRFPSHNKPLSGSGYAPIRDLPD